MTAGGAPAEFSLTIIIDEAEGRISFALTYGQLGEIVLCTSDGSSVCGVHCWQIKLQ